MTQATEPLEASGGFQLRRLLHPVFLCVLAAYLLLIAVAWWGLTHIIPDTVVLHLPGRDHLLREVHQRVINRTLEIGFLLPSVFLLEHLWTGWRGGSLRHLLVDRTASARSDLVCYLFQMVPAWTLVSAVMSFGLAYVSGQGLRSLLARQTGIDLSIAGAPLPAQIAVLFVLYTLVDYWSHRLDHSRVFWPLHRFHHAAESFSVLTAGRIHPAMFTAVLGAVLPGALLGSSPSALAGVGVVIVVIRLLIHSRIESNFGWIGRWVVQSPLHHRLHHSLNRMPVNLGLLPIWDRLFGTWRDAPQRAMPIGTPAHYRHGAWIGPDLWRDYREFGAGVRRLAVKACARLAVPRLAPERVAVPADRS